MRNRGGWSKEALQYVDRVNEILAGLQGYWPLTLRQVYYQLVAAGDIQNNTGQYNKLSRILTKARLSELVSWDAIEDRSRSTLSSYRWGDRDSYISAVTEYLFKSYRRDLLQDQAQALEIWVEKDALSRVCERSADPYGVPVIVARGFSSISYVHECRKRILENIGNGHNTVILYFGDLDPSGWEMLPAMLETLQREMNLGDLVTGVRCALKLDQVNFYNLPKNPDALKPTDTRAKKYMKLFGDLAVELDALPPAELEALVKKAIEDNIDISLYTAQQQQAKVDIKSLSSIREKVKQYIRKIA
ncbi:MAG: hypothetical protein AB2L14_07020 [Candidatus Xenobiia bacterium LiM19]